jgi:hypothetical protein
LKVESCYEGIYRNRLFTCHLSPYHLSPLMKWLRTNWRVVLRVPVLVGLAVFLFGLTTLLRSFVQSSPPLITTDLALPTVTTTSQEIELTLYESHDVRRPVRVTLELPTDPSQRYRMLLTAVRDNLGGVWSQALPLPEVFLLEDNNSRSVTLHFRFDEPITVSVIDEVRLYNSIIATLKANGANQVHLLVNDNAETFLGHVSLDNALD